MKNKRENQVHGTRLGFHPLRRNEVTDGATKQVYGSSGDRIASTSSSGGHVENG
jgi:hypothetical protein